MYRLRHWNIQQTEKSELDDGLDDEVVKNKKFLIVLEPWTKEQLPEDKKKKIIVNYGSPFIITDYFPEDVTIIETNSQPCAETVKAIADGLFGDMEFVGKPVIDYEKNTLIHK